MFSRMGHMRYQGSECAILAHKIWVTTPFRTDSNNDKGCCSAGSTASGCAVARHMFPSADHRYLSSTFFNHPVCLPCDGRQVLGCLLRCRFSPFWAGRDNWHNAGTLARAAAGGDKGDGQSAVYSTPSDRIPRRRFGLAWRLGHHCALSTGMTARFGKHGPRLNQQCSPYER